MNNLQTFWDAFRTSQAERELSPEPPDMVAFGDSSERANQLGELVRDGIKTAMTSALWVYEPDEQLPQVGELSVVLDGDKQPLCIIETTEVCTIPFAEVDAAFAFDEGERNRSLDYWREGYRRFFRRALPEIGRTFDEQMSVVCERFRKVYPI